MYPIIVEMRIKPARALLLSDNNAFVKDVDIPFWGTLLNNEYVKHCFTTWTLCVHVFFYTYLNLPTITKYSEKETMIDNIYEQIQFGNLPVKVMDRGVFWETKRTEKGWKLQRNTVTGHGRILDRDGVRIAWGDFGQMRSSFNRFIKPWKGCKKGDILAVQRAGGVYAHYAVYIGRGRVIHYGSKSGNPLDECTIHKADFSEFLKKYNCYEIIHFPDDGSDPEHETVVLTLAGEDNDSYNTRDLFTDYKAALRRIKGYKLFSAEETVERAKSRLGENKYSLAFNNCEHFALWCKTGLRESSQVENFWKRFWTYKNYKGGDRFRDINMIQT